MDCRLVKTPRLIAYRQRFRQWNNPPGPKRADYIAALADCKAVRSGVPQPIRRRNPPKMPDDTLTQIAASLQRIADRLEMMAPSGEHNSPALGEADAYHWDAAIGRLMPVPKVARVPFGLLKGIDGVR